MAYLSTEWNGTEYFPIHDFHHVEYLVGNAKQAVYYYRSALGFEPHAYCGPETGVREKVSYVLKKNRQYFVFTTPLNSEHFGWICEDLEQFIREISKSRFTRNVYLFWQMYIF